MKKNIFTFLSVLIISVNAFSQVITVSTLTTGLTRPACIQNSGLPNDNRLFVCEKVGRIRIIDRNSGALTATPFLNITSIVKSTGNEQGLLGLAFHPDYATNGYFYVFYTTYNGVNGDNVVARYQVSSFADTALTSSGQIIFTIYKPSPNATNHNGGNLMFDWDGRLYINIGDGGVQNDPFNHGQKVDSVLGKILRIDVNNPGPPYYTSPASNPFYGGGAPATIPYALPLPGRNEIFDWGFRNPWRSSIDRMTGDKWIADVGQNTYEEVDFESRCDSTGSNYGWRCYEGNTPFNSTGCQPQSSYTSPVFVYSHSLGCSISGGYVYRGGQEGKLFGKYLCADYCSGRIWAVYPNGTGGWSNALLTQTNSLLTNNISTWGEDVYGELYLAGDALGRIYKVVDTACAPTAYINAPDTMIHCAGGMVTLNAIFGTGLQYTWYVNGAVPPGGMSATQSLPVPTNPVQIYVTVNNGTCTATSDTVTVFTDATFSNLDSFYCINAGTDTLAGLPAGGTFSGPGMNGNVFDPVLAGSGVHIITYTFADTVSTCYYTASNCVLTDTQYVTVDLCLGIEEPNNISGLQIYPNPNPSEFSVEFSLLQNSDVIIYATDAVGRNIYEKKTQCNRGKQNYSVNLDAADGVYFLFLKVNHSTAVSKIIVQH